MVLIERGGGEEGVEGGKWGGGGGGGGGGGEGGGRISQEKRARTPLKGEFER